MSQSLRILLSVVLIWPVAYHGFSIAGKPVDLVASDFLPLALAIALGRAIPFRDLQALRLRTSFRLAAFWCAAFVVCCLAIAAFGFVASGEKIRVASALKFVKPISFFLVGQLLAPVLGTVNFLQILPRTCLGLILASGLSTLLAPGFPNGAWGKTLGGFELYGYPNSPMTFFGSLVPFLLAGALYDSRAPLRPLYYIAVGIVFATLAGSMSRSSTGVGICGMLIFWWLTRNRRALGMVAVLGICIGLFGISLEHWTQEYEFVASLKERVETRLERTIHSDDALSGRDEIWVETLELVSARPFFGYCFEPFSNYTFYSTPHQQYLEILFKTGGIGLAVFLLFFGYAALLVVQLWRRFADDIVMGPATAAIAASLLAVCIGNLTQPNFTYSVTGNFQFFILGLLLSESTIARLLVNRAAREDLKQQPRATSTTPPLKPFGSPEALRPDRPDATPTRETTASQFSGWHIHLQRQPAIVPRPQLPQSHQKSI